MVVEFENCRWRCQNEGCNNEVLGRYDPEHPELNAKLCPKCGEPMLPIDIHDPRVEKPHPFKRY